MQLKRFHLLSCAVLALGLVSPGFAADEPKPKSDAEIEAKLEAARERLEAAAREVAELSGELTGPVMHDFMIRRHEPRAVLGVNLAGREEQSKDGVRIESVTPGGPASDAGLKAGDVLVSVDGKTLRKPSGESSAGALIGHMRGVKPGDKVKLEYQRDGKTQQAEVTAEAMDMRRFMMRPNGQRFEMTAPVAGVVAMPPMPPMGDMPFTMAFRGFPGHGLHDMELITLTPKLGHYFGTEKGVLVVRPPRDSELKLEEGDVIVDIDGRAPQSGGHAMRILRSYQPGEKVNINVLRNRKSVKLTYTMPKGEGDANVWFGEPEFERRVIEPLVEPAPGAEGT